MLGAAPAGLPRSRPVCALGHRARLFHGSGCGRAESQDLPRCPLHPGRHPEPASGADRSGFSIASAYFSTPGSANSHHVALLSLLSPPRPVRLHDLRSTLVYALLQQVLGEVHHSPPFTRVITAHNRGDDAGFVPVTNVLFPIPIFGKVAQFAIPVANYVHKSDFTREQRYREAILDTFDCFTRLDHPMTATEVREVLDRSESESSGS